MFFGIQFSIIFNVLPQLSQLLQFVYGEGMRDAVNFVSHFPKELDMFIFPAWLKHWVCPFKSDCTRISVSGNVYDITATKGLVKSERVAVKS